MLNNNESVYSCNSYLVVGDFKRLEDMNTLIDTGTNGNIINEIETLFTGAGKSPVEQIILTHNHFDHSGGLSVIKNKYNPKVFAFGKSEGVDIILADGQIIRVGDVDFEVIYTPGHSNDSICLYSEDEGVLFSGDTTLKIEKEGCSYSRNFVKALEKISRRNVKAIYSGHDQPILKNTRKIIRDTLLNIKSPCL